MIQRPPPNEVVSDVPGKGSIVDYRDSMQRVFGGRLLKGRVIDDAGERAVEWAVPEGFSKASSDSPGIETASRELMRFADEADSAASEVGELLRRAPAATQVRVPRGLTVRLGGSGSADFVLWADAELRPRRDLLVRVAAAVRRAVARGNFVESAHGEVMLFGWAFLPPTWSDPFDTPRSGRVTLAFADDPMNSDQPIVALKWSTEGPVREVELVRVDGAEAVIRDTRAPVKGDLASDYWRFPPSDLPAGARYVARATGLWGRADSNVVEVPVPADPIVPVAPRPPVKEPVTPPVVPTPVPFEPLPPPKSPPPAPPTPRSGRAGCWLGWWRWLLWLLLLLLALLLLLWLLGWLWPAFWTLLCTVFGPLLAWLFGWTTPVAPYPVDETIVRRFPYVVWGDTYIGDRFWTDPTGATWIHESESDTWTQVTPDGVTRPVSAWQVPPPPSPDPALTQPPGWVEPPVGGQGTHVPPVPAGAGLPTDSGVKRPTDGTGPVPVPPSDTGIPPATPIPPQAPPQEPPGGWRIPKVKPVPSRGAMLPDLNMPHGERA